MPRLFVGLDLPPMIKDGLIAASGDVVGARWQTAQQLHLTLRFIGEVGGDTASDIADILALLRFSAFELAVGGVGAFGKPDRPRALWAGVRPEAPLLALHKKIDHALQGLDLTKEERRFKPHITLARLVGRVGPIDAFLARHGDLALPAYPVEDFCLFLSRPGHGGAHYEVIERYPAR